MLEGQMKGHTAVGGFELAFQARAFRPRFAELLPERAVGLIVVRPDLPIEPRTNSSDNQTNLPQHAAREAR